MKLFFITWILTVGIAIGGLFIAVTADEGEREPPPPVENVIHFFEV